MIRFYKNYIDNLLELHNDIRGILAEVPQDALDWVPGAEINSLSVLVIHLTGAERYWIGDVIADEPSGRDREAEFKRKDLTAKDLVQLLDGNDSYIAMVLEKYNLEELNKTRISPRNGREVPVGWALSHALKHTAMHLGHLQIMRQLWEQQHSNKAQSHSDS